MQYVIIKCRAPTTKYDRMPLFLYDRPLKVIEETENTVTVRELCEYYTYEFNKKYIERYL